MVTLIDKKERTGTRRRRTQFPDVIAVIPAYNAAGTIAQVVRKVRRKVRRCFVVDDGSTDGTADAAKRAGARLIVHASNRGKGAAVRTALTCLKNEAFKYVVLLDADGQHEPGEISRFVQEAQRRRVDVVCGTRMTRPEGMPWIRRATNRTMSWIVSRLCRVKLSDTQCGYRLLSRRAVEKIKLRKSNFEVDSEVLFEATRHGLNVSEVTITSIYADDHSSHIRPVRDTWRFLRLVGGLLLARCMKRR